VLDLRKPERNPGRIYPPRNCLLIFWTLQGNQAQKRSEYGVAHRSQGGLYALHEGRIELLARANRPPRIYTGLNPALLPFNINTFGVSLLVSLISHSHSPILAHRKLNYDYFQQPDTYIHNIDSQVIHRPDHRGIPDSETLRATIIPEYYA
jgi:hypothetical protein